MSSFKESLFSQDQFTLTFELVPSRGGRTKGQSRILEWAGQAAADGRLHAVSITENAGGHPALSPEVLGIEIQEMGLEVISHFSCKDKNRNQMESLLFGWDREGLHNLLVISGDYPQRGYLGRPKPVFDLDSVQVLDLISRMNCGIIESNRSSSQITFQPTSFLKGVAVSPFKILPSELALQYAKLHRKVEAGADYVITQLGYDARKFDEILLYMKLNNIDLPVLGNVFIPNLAVAGMMYKGGVPGCVISESLYEQIMLEASSADRGKKARLMRVAKLLVVFKGLGYAGAHIGGPGLKFKDLDFVITEADKITAHWQELVPELSYWPRGGAYFFSRDAHSGLNLSRPRRAGRQGHSRLNLSYTVSHCIHNLFFKPGGLFFDQAKSCCLGIDRAGYGSAFARFEHLLKLVGFNCQNCGDCRLADLAYLCPQSGCAKYMLNGPCGGSRDGWCEVYPGRKRCFYVKVFERLQALEMTGIFQDGFFPPRDWARNNSSSWINFFKDFEESNPVKWKLP